MGRRSRQAEIEQLIETLREKIPGVVIRTSLITGFPGETEEDFDTLLGFIKEYKLDKVGVFPYSREEGTPAAEYSDQVDGDVAEQRRDVIMSAQQEISSKLCADRIGTSVEVIIEGYDEDEFCYVGRSSTDTPDVDGVAFVYSEDELMAGDIVTAEVIDANEYDIITKVGGQNL